MTSLWFSGSHFLCIYWWNSTTKTGGILPIKWSWTVILYSKTHGEKTHKRSFISCRHHCHHILMLDTSNPSPSPSGNHTVKHIRQRYPFNIIQLQVKQGIEKNCSLGWAIENSCSAPRTQREPPQPRCGWPSSRSSSAHPWCLVRSRYGSLDPRVPHQEIGEHGFFFIKSMRIIYFQHQSPYF